MANGRVSPEIRTITCMLSSLCLKHDINSSLSIGNHKLILKYCFFPIGLMWTRLSPIKQSFDLPDGRPESPPIAPCFLTQLSHDYINESSRLFCWLGKVGKLCTNNPYRGLLLLLNSFCQSTVKWYYIRKYAE